MRSIIQTSKDGKKWEDDLSQTFNNKNQLKHWFDRRFEASSSYDWRVGFLVRDRAGIYYRAIYLSTGKEVKYPIR